MDLGHGRLRFVAALPYFHTRANQKEAVMPGRKPMSQFEITDEMVERSSICLFGELTAGSIKSTPVESQWVKEDLRLAARRVLVAASDPKWGTR